jgi:DNA-binding winged helix-turn-helix (wHTH) protein
VLDREAGRITGTDGEEVRLRPQAFKMLEVLVAAAPRILTQEELLDRVWGVEHLSPASVKQTVSEVRLALGDDPARPAVIETVHRRGYRCIAPVTAIAAIAPVHTAPIAEPAPARQASREWETRPIIIVSSPPPPLASVPEPPRRGWHLALVFLMALLGSLSALARVRMSRPEAKSLPATGRTTGSSAP